MFWRWTDRESVYCGSEQEQGECVKASDWHRKGLSKYTVHTQVMVGGSLTVRKEKVIGQKCMLHGEGEQLSKGLNISEIDPFRHFAKAVKRGVNRYINDGCSIQVTQ